MTKRVLRGVVTSNVCNKTITVKVERVFRHAKYKKTMTNYKKYAVHDELNSCKVGDVVAIEESRPISKTKRWILKPISSEVLADKAEKNLAQLEA